MERLCHAVGPADFEGVDYGYGIGQTRDTQLAIAWANVGADLWKGFGLVKGSETVVLRLASGWWESGISKLLADGRPAETPAALILNPGQPGQHRVSAPLGELARKAATYGLRGDALLGQGDPQPRAR